MRTKVKDRVNIKNYKGYIFVYSKLEYRNGEVEYKYTFRRGDSIWSEYFTDGLFEQFETGDTIK